MGAYEMPAGALPPESDGEGARPKPDSCDAAAIPAFEPGQKPAGSGEVLSEKVSHHEIEPLSPLGGSANFEDTNWWVIRKASREVSAETNAAQTALVQSYWRPIYGYLRWRRFGHEDAQDLTQEFLSRVLSRNSTDGADPARGKFRSYMLMLLNRFLADHWDRSQRQKRGGGASVLSLDGADTEFRERHEPSHDHSPDKMFDRLWARSLLDAALEKLRQQHAEKGRVELFESLKPFVLGEGDVNHAAAAAELQLSAGAFKVKVHRLRMDLREAVRAEIAGSTPTADGVGEEMQDFLAALQANGWENPID